MCSGVWWEGRVALGGWVYGKRRAVEMGGWVYGNGVDGWSGIW